jgi:hypothetical protein
MNYLEVMYGDRFSKKHNIFVRLIWNIRQYGDMRNVYLTFSLMA